MKRFMRTISLILVFVLMTGVSVNAATLINGDTYLDLEQVNIVFTPDKYLGLYLYAKEFDRRLMTEIEEEINV